MAEHHPVTFHPGGAPGAASPNGASKDLDDEDPFEFVAMRFASPPGHDADLEMTRTFVEEFALMGYSREKLRALFETKFYAGTHDVLLRRGSKFVDAVLDEVFAGAAPATEGN